MCPESSKEGSMQAGLERRWETTHPSARLLYGLIVKGGYATQ